MGSQALCFGTPSQHHLLSTQKRQVSLRGQLCGPVVKNLPCMCEDLGLISNITWPLCSAGYDPQTKQIKNKTDAWPLKILPFCGSPLSLAKSPFIPSHSLSLSFLLKPLLSSWTEVPAHWNGSSPSFINTPPGRSLQLTLRVFFLMWHWITVWYKDQVCVTEMILSFYTKFTTRNLNLSFISSV